MNITKITIEDVYLYDVQQYKFDDFKNVKITGGTTLGWCDGIVYWLAMGNDSEFMQKQLVEKKTLHILAFDYAEMKEHQHIIKNDHGFETICVDQSSNQVVRRIIEHVKENY